jgi:hypothetical protein
MKLLLVAIVLLLSFSTFASDDPSTWADEPTPQWINDLTIKCLRECGTALNAKLIEGKAKAESCCQRGDKCGLDSCLAQAAHWRAECHDCEQACFKVSNDLTMRDWCTRHGLDVNKCWPDLK